MKEINNEIYLHIHKRGEHSDKWKIGNVFKVGESLNQFVGFYEKCNSNINGVDPLNYLDNVIFSGGSHNNASLLSLLKISKDILKEYVFFMRESVFENVRKEKYEDYPSRFKGVWVLKNNEEALSYWKQELIRDNQEFEIYKVSLTGIIHETSQEHLEVKASYNLTDWRILAENYWEGKCTRHSKEIECLFEGEIEVLEKV